MEYLNGEPTIVQQNCITWMNEEEDDFESADEEYFENPEKYDDFYHYIIFENGLSEISKYWNETRTLPGKEFIAQIKWYMENVNYFEDESPNKSLAYYLCMFKYMMNFPEMANSIYRKYLYDCTLGLYKWRCNNPQHHGVCEVYSKWALFIKSFSHPK